MKAASIEIFKNLAQYEYVNQYYDLHNDYDFHNLSFSKEILLISFKHVSEGITLTLSFSEVVFSVVEFFNVSEVLYLTLDNLYRGKFEQDGKLAEFAANGKGYFYLEFCEGQRLEFWAMNIGLDKE